MEDIERKENEEWMKRMHNLYVKSVCSEYSVSPFPYLYAMNYTPRISKQCSDIIKIKRSKEINDKV